MSNKIIKEIYNEIFNEVYPQVKTFETGFLYKVVQVIVGEEQPEKSREICNYLNISPDADIKNDHIVIDDLVEIIETTHPVIKKTPAKSARNFAEGISNQSRSFNPPSEKERMEEMKWLIAGACILVGMYFCIEYFKKVKKRRLALSLRPREDTGQQLPLPSPPSPAELCLVVPAKIVGNLEADFNLRASDVEHLIDNASYFLCTDFEKAVSNEKRLAWEEYVPSDSQKEVYIRVHVSDGGRDLIDKKIPYILKRNLPDTAQFTIKKRACLRNLSGLEEFNLV